MANQAYIIRIENEVLNGIEALAVELKNNEGQLNPGNRDVWGTLGVNARVLASRISDALEKGAK